MLRIQHQINHLKRKKIISETVGQLAEEQQHMQSQKSFQPKHRMRRQYNPDDINIAKLFTAIREHRAGNPPKDKLSKITTLLDQIQNINDIDFNDNGNTPLHVAVSKDHQDIIKLLLEKGAKVDIKNNIGDTPLDIAKKSNKKEIVQLLETHRNSIGQEPLIGYSRSGPSNQINSGQQLDSSGQAGQSTLESGVRRDDDIAKPSGQVETLLEQEEVKRKLTEFVEDFVSIYESSLSEYYERLENRRSKPGKWADFANKVIETGKGATEGIEVTGIKASSIVGINTLQSIVSSASAWHNRKELKKLISQLYVFKEDPDRVREKLVRSGVDVFRSFESQFTQVASNGSWQRAMAKLAEDAVSRVINYYKRNAKEEFSASSITKGVILGKSKKYKHTSTDTPHIKPGHTLEDKNSNSWNTAELFDKAGLAIIKSDGTADKYYKRKDGKSNTSKYGYRLLFQWESVDEEYRVEKPTSEEYKYILKPNEKKNLEDILLDKVNNQDPKLMEERLIKNYEEGMERIRQEAEENVNKLEKFINDNSDNLLSYIEDHQNEIKEIFNRIEQQSSRYHQEASQQRQEIVNSIDKGFEQTNQKLDEIHSVVVTGQESKQVRKPISFDVRESVQSFTGRQEQLDQIATTIKQGIVVISGLGGVGKSELAIKYAHKDYNGNVIWINAETHETAKDSFRRLLKELELKTRDQDGDEKSVGLMAKEVYDFFAGKESLFIFDNAREYSIIKEFLPLGTSGYHVLITSQNLQLFNEQEHRKIERLSLDTLPEDKAIEFVKKALNINNTLQDKEIKELVKTLGYLPLALQHAVSYIKESGYVETIDKCIEIYKRSEQEIQSFLNREGLSSYDKNIFLTFKTTIDKVKQEENGKLAEEILNTIAYFAPDNIPKETFLKLAQDRVEESDVSIKNDRANGMLTRAINLLGQYSVINLKEEQVSIHKLVQEVIRSGLKKQSEEGRVLEEVLEKALGLLREYTKAAPGNAASCIPHIISIWDYASKYDELIKSFIVDSTNNKATTSTTYFDLVIEGSNYEVIDAIIKKISSDNLKEVINGKSKDDVTPLHKAVLRNDEKIVKLLIDKGADVNVKKSNGWTPLHLAAKNGNLEVVNALLEKGANIDAKTSSKYQFTPLHLAARNGHKEVIEALLAKNANVNAKTGYEFTPLHLAADNGHLEAVQALLKDNQIIINAETKDKFTPLHLAAKRGHLSVVEALLVKNADVNAQNKDGFTPLHLAALNGHAKIVNKLLENYKIDIDARTTEGNTPLHLAAEKGHLEIVKALIAKNADIDIKNEDGNTALDLAHLEVKDYISSIYKRTKGAAGIEGQLCEINLSMLFLLKGVTDEQIGGFHLASNMEKADKFDDIVFKYEYREGITEKSKIVFLQAKHKIDQKGININSLLSDSESGDFSLKKYFISYRKIKQQFSETKGPVFSSKFEDSEFIIYTNAPFVSTDSSVKEGNIDQNDFFRISDSQSKYYQLEFNSNKKERVVNLLKNSSYSRRLAKELVQSISSGKGVDMQKDIFQSYHIALQGKVIEKIDDKLEGKLSYNFLNDDVSLSLEDKEFRRVFLEEAGEVFKKQGNELELKQELQNKVIKLSNKFGVSSGSENLELPNDDPVSEDEIKDFLNKFKLFASQPSEKDLEKIIKDKVKEVYKVEQQDIDSVFSDVEYKVKKWWQSGNNYLKKDNKFFEDAARISINFDVKEPVTLFTGRIRELENLHEILQDGGEAVISQMASVTGLGGIGKSELARKYISEHNKEYDNNVIWINADNYLTIAESFRRLAQDKLQISTVDENGKEKEIKFIVEDVYRFFAKRHRRSLFVFDNAGKHKAVREGEEAEGVDKFLPSGPNKPHVLITSRDQEWGEIKSLPLGVFTEEEAIEFIKKALKDVVELEENEVKRLAEELQYLPLALKQAVAYIKVENQGLNKWEEGKFTIGSYLEQFKEKANELLSRESSETRDRYTKTVMTTWQITIDKIKQKKVRGGEQALEILDVTAYLAPDKIPVDEIFSKLIDDEEVRHSAVELLDQYSMANLDGGKLNIHRLVQQVTRIKLGDGNEEEEVVEKALGVFKDNISSNNVDHAISAWDHAKKYNKLVKEFSKLPSQIIGKLDDSVRYEEAYLFGIKASELLKKVLGDDHPDTLTAQSYIARILKNQGRYNEALQILRTVFSRREAVLGQDHSDTLATENDMAAVLSKQGNYDEALLIFKEVLDKKKQILGPDHLDTLITSHNIAGVLKNQGKYSESLQVYWKVLDKYGDILGSSHPDTLRTENAIADLFWRQGEYDKALLIFKNVLDKRERILGSNHPDTLMTQNNMALILNEQGRYVEALQIYEDVFSKYKDVLGLDHPDTLTAWSNMALTLDNQGEYNKALEIYQKIHHKEKDILGSDHPDALITMDNIGGVLYEQGKYEEALKIAQEVYEVRKKKLGANHPDTLRTKGNMAIVLSKHGEHDKALEVLQEVYEEKKQELGEDHPNTLATQSNIATVLETQGKYNEALKVLQEVYEKSKKKLGESHPDTREAKGNLDRLSQLLGSSGEHEIQMAEECLPSTSHRKKREAAGECLFTWEDVDEFNEEKGEKRDFGKIKIDSEKFVSYIKDLPEGKQSQLIQLADKVKVTGESQGLIHKLTNNRRVMSHLARVGKISGITMHGMMAKNVLADFLNGDYQGVAINVGFIAGGQGFAKVAEAASIKGLKLASEGKLLLGRSLKAASPFLARGTSAFVIYDLVNQVKAFKNGTEEALIGVIGDSIYLGVDAAEIGIEIAEAFEVLEGVSSITGPIGATIGAVVFVGTDIYMAVKRVDKIDQIIHLKGNERFIEGLRAFIGMQPEKHIEELIEEKQLNNQLVKQGLEYLQQHSGITGYVFPTGKLVEGSCRLVPYKTTKCDGRLYLCSKTTHTITYYTKKCATKFEEDLDNTVLLDKRRANIKWSRAKPDNPRGGQLFCLPQGNYRLAPSYGSYLCKSAIGITNLSANKTESYTLVNLGEGEGYAKGFLNSPNIFVVNNGSKKYFGGNKDDVFVLQGSSIIGYLSGEDGVNTLDLTSFASEEGSIDVKLHIGQVEDYSRDNSFRVSGISKFLGRKTKADQVFIACDGANDVKFVDGQGGSEEFVDHINIHDKDCAYEMQVVVRSNTIINNRALKGDFHYIVPYALGNAKVDFIYTARVLDLNNTFTFEYEPIEIKNIDVKNINVLNKTSHTISFNFLPVSDKEFNITISGASNPSYRLGNNTEIKVGNKSNLYMLENTNKSVDEIIKNYLVVANRLNKMSFFIQSLLSNETVVIGSGNYEIIHNNPLYKSHLVGNGGENVYVIDSEYKALEVKKLPLPEVTIYNFDAESSVDTIDLRSLAQQARSKFSNSFELQVLKSTNDLLLKATVTEVKPTEDLSVSKMRKHEYFTVRLKDGVNWYNKTHLIVDSTPMKINLNNNEWSLKPQPLIFEKDKEVIVVTSQDVEENTELTIPKRAGNYTFVRDHGIDLIITNAFDVDITKEDLCTITLGKFYKEPKMETLSIKFADKEIILKDHQEQISIAREMNVVAKEYKDQVYNDVFNRTESSPKVIMLSDQPITHKHRHEHNRHRQKIRHRRSDNITNSSTRPSSWINSCIAWMKAKSSLLTSSIINPIGRWFIDDQDINAFSENKSHDSATQNNLKTLDFSQIDVNGTILLTDVLLAKRGKRQIYTSSMDQGLSQSQTLGYTLNIGRVFEEAIKKAALKSGISERRLNIDFVEIEKEINNKIARGRFDEISQILKSYAEKACPRMEKGSTGMLSPKKLNKFMAEFNNLSLDQSIQQILYNSKNNVLEDNSVQKQQRNSNLENKKPKSYLDNIATQGYLTQVRDLM